MKFAASLMCTALALAANGVAAQDAMKNSSKDAAKPMTMQECKDYMAMTKTDAMKKDPAMMKKDSTCADMMKKEPSKMDTGSKMDSGMAPKK